MESFVFLDFSDDVKFREYQLYKEKLIKSLAVYFTVLTKTYDPNIVGKRFSVYISIGKPCENNTDSFYRYLEYKSKAPGIQDIVETLAEMYNNYNKYCIPNKKRTNVIVFDMDDTLINYDTIPFYKTIFEELKEYKEYFDYIILWTHGTTPYLEEVKLDFKFDLYMSRSYKNTTNKGLGAVFRELNNKYNVSKLDFCVLVDDLSDNFIDDYDLFVKVDKKPTKGSYKRTLDEIVKRLNKYINKQSFKNQINIQ